MITLKQAIKLLNLSDDDIIYFCHKHHERFAPSYTVKEIREKFDMKNTNVKNIYPYHFRYDNDISWEFIIKC